jgi:hypothetical protein
MFRKKKQPQATTQAMSYKVLINDKATKKDLALIINGLGLGVSENHPLIEEMKTSKGIDLV